MLSKHLTLYSRLGCHLCEDMEAQLPPYLEPTGISLDIIYIDKNDKLEQVYGTLVPVLKADELEICHYFLDIKALQQYISEVGNPLN